jgi:hypothetical protein
VILPGVLDAPGVRRYPVPDLRRPYGKINLIGLVLLLAVASFIYGCIFFSTAYLDNLDLKTQISAAFNQAAMLDDQGLRRFIEAHTGQVGNHIEEDPFGNPREVLGLGLKDDDITIERNEVAQTILIRVDYMRRIVLKPTTRVYWLRLHPQLAGPIPPRG